MLWNFCREKLCSRPPRLKANRSDNVPFRGPASNNGLVAKNTIPLRLPEQLCRPMVDPDWQDKSGVDVDVLVNSAPNCIDWSNLFYPKESNASPKKTEIQFPDAATFASSIGEAVWLMTISKQHRDLKISKIEELITPAILLQQFKIYMKGKQPVAFLSWALVSDTIKVRFDAGDRKLKAHEWRSGNNIVVVECVSPFAATEAIVEQFISGLKNQGNRTP